MEALVEYEYESVQDDELSLKVGNVVKNISQAEDGWMKGELDGKKGVFPENFVRILQSSDKGQIILDKGGLSKREAPQRKSVRELASNFRDFAPMGLAGPAPKRKVEKKKCKVIYEYKPENEDELELQLGDMVDFIKEVEDGWYEGHLGEKTGVFPSNFVEFVTVSEENNEETPVGELETGDNSEGETKSKVKTTKVPKIGLGNIFQAGPITLRPVGSKRAVPLPPDKPLEVKESIRLPAAAPTCNTNDVVKREKPTTGEKAIVRYSYAADQPDELNLKEGEIVNVLNRNLEDDGWWRGEVNGKVGVFPDNFVELLTPEDVLKPKTSKGPPATLYPKLPDKAPVAMTVDNHDNKKQMSGNVKNTHKKESDIKGIKPHIPPPIGKKPSAHKSSDPPKFPESSKQETSKIILTSSKDNQNKFNSSQSHVEENNHYEDHVHFEDLEPKSEKLVHLTASRPKGPKKRPPSSVFTPMDGEENDSEDTVSSIKESTPPVITSNTDKIPGLRNSGPRSATHEHLPTEDISKERPKINQNVPPRPPAPDTSAHGSGPHLQRMVEELQRNLKDLRSNTVSKSAFNELKAELESMKSLHTKKLRELMNEVDDEKKLRLNTQVEIERIKKLLAETNV